MTETDPRKCDPALPAPPMVVPLDPHRDVVGHGRTLPMVGSRRNYLFDVVPDSGDVHVYADTAQDVLACIIPGYGDLIAQYTEALAAGDRDSTERLEDDMFMARSDYCTQHRVTLQQKINAAAQERGVWGQLTQEERDQLTGAAEGGIPAGVELMRPWTLPDGTIEWVVQGVWETPLASLVINRSDYGLFSPHGTPEPISELETPDPETGEPVVYITATPPNMVLLDATSDQTVMDSLCDAGVWSVEHYIPETEDTLYLECVRTGKLLIEQQGIDVESTYAGWNLASDSDHQHHHHD